MGNLTANFSTWELRCKCGCGFMMPDWVLLYVLQRFRLVIGIPFTPNSCCRCPRHNASLPDSSPKSQHMQGKAVDIPLLQNWTVESMAQVATTIPFPDIPHIPHVPSGNAVTGLGYYDWGIHVDVRLPSDMGGSDAFDFWDRRT